MDLIQNLTCRAKGKGLASNCDFAIPRLISLSDDTFLRVGLQVGDEEIGDGECMVARFCPYNYHQADILALADEDGFVNLQDTSKHGETSIMASFRAHENAIFDLAWMTSHSGHLHIVTASGDKTVALWDAATLKRRCVIKCHEQSLRTVCAHPDIPGLLVTGGRDGKIFVHDNRCDMSFPVNTIVGAHVKAENKRSHLKKGYNSPNQSVASLVLKDEHCLISGGFTDGLVKVWDLRRTYTEQPLRQPAPLHCLPVGGTVTSLVLPPRDVLLYASGSSNAILCFDAINFNEKPVCKFVGHSTNSAYSSYLQASVSSCGSYLACGSMDGDVYLWPTRLRHATLERDEQTGVPSVLPIVRLEGHSDEVTCVQWSPRHNELKLVSLSDDTTHRIWRVGPSLEGDGKPTESNTGFAKVTDPLYFKSHAPKRFYASVVPECEKTTVPHISSLPSFVDNPSSLVHKCSPRAPKQRTNWLSALSPQNAIPSAGKVVKLKRPTNGKKRKSSKKLQLASPHFKALLKPRTPKI